MLDIPYNLILLLRIFDPMISIIDLELVLVSSVYLRKVVMRGDNDLNVHDKICSCNWGIQESSQM